MKKTIPFIAIVAVIVVCTPSVAFAQGGASPASPVTFGMVLAALLGFMTMAYNTGSILGIKTVPKPALPYIGLAITFVAGFSQVISNGSLTLVGFEAALLAGFAALTGNATGAAAHALFTAHKSSRGVDATESNGSGPTPGVATKGDTAPPANDVQPTPPPAAARGTYR